MQQQHHLLLQCLQFTLSARMNDYGTLFCEKVLELKVLVSIRIVEFNIQNSFKFHCNNIPRRGQQFIETYWNHHPQIASRATQSVIIFVAEYIFIFSMRVYGFSNIALEIRFSACLSIVT